VKTLKSCGFSKNRKEQFRKIRVTPQAEYYAAKPLSMIASI
jgi:hypothetical protein